MAEIRIDPDKVKEVWVDENKCQYVWIDECRIGFERFTKIPWQTIENMKTYFVDLSDVPEVILCGMRFRGYSYKPPDSTHYTSYNSELIGSSSGSWVDRNITGPSHGWTTIGRQGGVQVAVTSGNTSFVAAQVGDGIGTAAHIGHGGSHTFPVRSGSSRTLNMRGRLSRGDGVVRLTGRVRTQYRRSHPTRYTANIHININDTWDAYFPMIISQGVIKPSVEEADWSTVFLAPSSIEGGDNNYYFAIPGVSAINNKFYVTIQDYGKADVEIIYLHTQ